jgi:hypothetical protein
MKIDLHGQHNDETNITNDQQSKIYNKGYHMVILSHALSESERATNLKNINDITDIIESAQA